MFRSAVCPQVDEATQGPSAVSHEQFLLSTTESGSKRLKIREGNVDGRLLNVAHVTVGKAALPCQFVLGVSAHKTILPHVVRQPEANSPARLAVGAGSGLCFRRPVACLHDRSSSPR